MRGDHPSLNFDAFSTHQPLLLLLMSERCNVGVKCSLQEISVNKKNNPLIVFLINANLIDKCSKATMCTPSINAEFQLCHYC
jgi:hypothetical protein